MNNRTPFFSFSSILTKNMPAATAWIQGGPENPGLSGLVSFYSTPYQGVLITAEIFGLPDLNTPDSSDFYGFHIHESGECVPPFTTAGGHYNPTNQKHPDHAGDMIPLLGNQGYAWLAFYDKRFSIGEIIGKSVIIHSMPDDFTSQPAGNSGTRIGCGIIYPV